MTRSPNVSTKTRMKAPETKESRRTTSTGTETDKPQEYHRSAHRSLLIDPWHT